MYFGGVSGAMPEGCGGGFGGGIAMQEDLSGGGGGGGFGCCCGGGFGGGIGCCQGTGLAALGIHLLCPTILGVRGSVGGVFFIAAF